MKVLEIVGWVAMGLNLSSCFWFLIEIRRLRKSYKMNLEIYKTLLRNK